MYFFLEYKVDQITKNYCESVCFRSGSYIKQALKFEVDLFQSWHVTDQRADWGYDITFTKSNKCTCPNVGIISLELNRCFNLCNLFSLLKRKWIRSESKTWGHSLCHHNNWLMHRGGVFTQLWMWQHAPWDPMIIDYYLRFCCPLVIVFTQWTIEI